MKTEQTKFRDNYVLPEEDNIICPWCLGMTPYNPEEQTCCGVCGREISEEDINYSQINERSNTMYNSNSHLIPLPANNITTNLSQGSYRASFFDLSEFQLSKVDFNTVFYNKSDPEAAVINGDYSFAFLRQDKLRTIHAYDKDGSLLLFNSFLNHFHINIRSRNLFKTCKYLSRVFRQVKYGSFFKSLKVHINKNHNGKQTDGISLISVDLARVLGWHNAEAGMSAQFTLFFGKGMVKGNCVISDKISSDVVIYGEDNIKPELNLGAGLQYVALEPVKLSESLRMDVQSLLNLWNVFGPEQYLSWAHSSIEQYKEDLILGRLSKHLDDFDDITEPEYDAQNWVLKQAVYHKIEYQRFPGLLRLGWTMLRNSIRTYANSSSGVPVFRIPVPGGSRGYLRPDLRQHDEFGNFKSSLSTGTVELDKYGNLWINPDDAELMLSILGGADFDDSCGIVPVQDGQAVIYRNPNQYGEVVLRQFLFCGKPVSSNNKLIGKIPLPQRTGVVPSNWPAILKSTNQLLDEFLKSVDDQRTSYIEYNKENLLRALIKVLNNTASIGAVANAEMVRTAIGIKSKSLHKQLMKLFPWNLERVIDSSIKDGIQTEQDMLYVQQMYEFIIQSNFEIPQSLLHRMPERLQTEVKIAKAHPVDQLLDALNKLIDMADKDILGSGSANKVNRIPGRIDFCNVPILEIGKVALENPFHDKAMGILKTYSQQMAIMLEKTKDLPDKEIQRKNGIRHIQRELLVTLNNCTPDERVLIVNAWAYQIYKSSACVHDSILWISDQDDLKGTAADTIGMLADLEEAYHVRVKFGVVMERYQEYRKIKPSVQCIRLWQKEELTASVLAGIKDIVVEDGIALLGDMFLKVGDEVKVSNGIYKIKEVVQAVSKRDKRQLKNSIVVYIC